MNKIEEGLIRQAGKGGMGLFKSHLVPADVRYAYAIGKSYDAARQQSQSSMDAEFVTFIEHHLKAHTESDDRFTRRGRLDHQSIETEFAQAVHRITECSDPEEHEFVGFAQYLLIARYDRRNALRCKSFFDAPEVSDSIIDDCDFQITPFVDITPWIRSSTRTACESARATDLKVASMM
jgi:hypothetical protein